MDKPLPFVTAALLCEKVLHEKDETLSVIRVADRVQYQPQALPPGIKPIIDLRGLVSIKSGPVIGQHMLKIVIEKPSGARKDAITFEVKLMGKDQGQNLILNIGLGIDEDGLYWFHVLFDDEPLTQIPLMVIPLQEETPMERKT